MSVCLCSNPASSWCHRFVSYCGIKVYSKNCVKRPPKTRQNEDVNNKWSLNEGRTYCEMLQGEHSAIHLTCIIKAIIGLETQFLVFLRMAALHRFYCILYVVVCGAF